MFSKTFLAASLLAAKAAATIFYAGVAESGGEFGVWSKSAVLSLKDSLLTDQRCYLDSRNWSPRSSWSRVSVHQQSRNRRLRGPEQDQSIPCCFPLGANVPHFVRTRSQVQ